MPHLPAWRRYLTLLGPDVTRDVDEELRFHLEMRVAEFVARGMSPAEARRVASERFGDVATVRAECERIEHQREQWMSRFRYLDELRQDLIYGVRALLRAPVFTLAAVASLALGIGANTAVFSTINAYLFQPLPVRDPHELVVIANTTSGSNVPGNISFPNYRDIQARRDLFTDVASYDVWTVSMRVDAGAERRWLQLITGNMFPMLGVRAARGRLFTEEEARRRDPVIVLAYDFWARRFERDPSIIGRAIQVNGLPFTVIGVTEPGFHGVQNLLALDAYAPITLLGQLDPTIDQPLERRDRGSHRVMGRLAPNVTVAKARAGLEVLARDLDRLYPEANKGLQFVIAEEVRSRPDIAVAYLMPWVATVFLVLVGLVLVIACANVANLLLARATVRQPEIALRRALGATPARLARQLLTESGLLAALGLAAGIAIAYAGLGWLANLHLATDTPVTFAVRPDWRVFAFTAVATIVAGAVSGFAPAMRGARVALTDALKEGGRGAPSGGARHRLRNLLVMGQVAVSLVLLICAGLFTRSVRAAANIPVGFSRDSVFMLSTDVSLQRYAKPRAQLFYRQLLERANALPGVTSAALGRDAPLGYSNGGIDVFFDVGASSIPDGHIDVNFNSVSPGYFATMGFALLTGREFRASDDETAPGVAIVNRPFVDRFLPGQNPIGKRFRVRKDGPTVEIVGVIAAAQYQFLGEKPLPFLYLPLAQEFASSVTLQLRTSGPPAQLAAPARAVVHTLDPELVVYDEKTMKTHLRDGLSLFFIRLAATLAAAVGLLGLTQTIVGLYGVISYAVSQRTREIGIRMALGAHAAVVLRTVVAQGMRPALIGLGLGLLGAVGLTRAMSALLLGVSATDALTYGIASLVLIVASLVATAIPAWRAARLNPSDALREA
jgi:predicted permease